MMVSAIYAIWCVALTCAFVASYARFLANEKDRNRGN